MPLVNRDKLRAKAEPDNGDVDFFGRHEMGQKETAPGGGARGITAGCFGGVNREKLRWRGLAGGWGSA
jgi:hypothetical protein